MGHWRFVLSGHPQFFDPQGRAVEIRSKKGIALIGLLATATNGMRSRVWVQQRLWGSRDVKQAQSSLRRELSNLRKVAPDLPLIANHRSIGLDLAQVEVDIRKSGAILNGEFLEGLDLPGERNFADWLKEIRTRLRERAEAASPVAEPAAAEAPAGIARPRITIHPVEAVDPDVPVPAQMTNFVRDIGAGLAARRWFEVRFESGGDDGPRSAPWGATENSGYELVPSFQAIDGKWIVNLRLAEAPAGTILTTKRREFGAAPDPETLSDGVSRAVNILIEALTSRCARLAARAAGAEDSVEALVWESRRHGGQFPPSRWLSAREILARAESSHDILAERIRMEFFVRFALQEDAGDVQDLVRASERIAKPDWTDPCGPLLLGHAKFLEGRPEQARELFAHAWNLDPHNTVAAGMCGLAEMATGNWTAGAEWLEKARRKMSVDRSIAQNLAYAALCDLYLGRPRQAISQASSAATLVSGWLLPWAVLIAAECESGNRASAESLGASVSASREQLDRLFHHLSLFGEDVVQRIREPMAEVGLVSDSGAGR